MIIKRKPKRPHSCLKFQSHVWLVQTIAIKLLKSIMKKLLSRDYKKTLILRAHFLVLQRCNSMTLNNHSLSTEQALLNLGSKSRIGTETPFYTFPGACRLRHCCSQVPRKRLKGASRYKRAFVNCLLQIKPINPL